MSKDKSALSAQKHEKSVSKNATDETDEDKILSQGDSKLSSAVANVNEPPRVTPNARRGRGGAGNESS